MRTALKTVAVMSSIALIGFVSSCKKDEVADPTISLEELGEGNSKTATIGDELHIDAEIEAEGVIKMIEVELHAEDGSGNEVEETFDYSDQDLKNTDFHDHIEIPSTFSAGEYHFHMTVTDKEGSTASVEDDVDIQE